MRQGERIMLNEKSIKPYESSENNKTPQKPVKPNENSTKIKPLEFFVKYRVLLIFFLIIIIAAILSDNFFSTSNILNVMRQVSVTATIAAGMTLVILIAGIDLSVGSVMAFAGAIAAGVLTADLPFGVAVFAALAIGLILGLFNGFIVSLLRLQSWL
jgi:ribose transport system permease protein